MTQQFTKLLLNSITIAATGFVGMLISFQGAASAQGTTTTLYRSLLSRSEPVHDKDSLDSPFAALRIGVIASPVASIDGGLDVTFPRLRIGKEWVSRLDIDLAARFNSRSFGSRRDASLGLTFCQVYTSGGVNHGRLFAGAGLGYFLGPQSGPGGKVFVGTNLSRVVSMEVEGQFPGDSTTRLVFMLRASAL